MTMISALVARWLKYPGHQLVPLLATFTKCGDMFGLHFALDNNSNCSVQLIVDDPNLMCGLGSQSGIGVP